MNAGRTIRVTEKTYQSIKQLATNSAMQDVVEEAVEALRRKRFFEDLDAGYAALRAEPAAWAEEQAERALWDNTAADGLEGL
jgi:hypothetical protein